MLDAQGEGFASFFTDGDSDLNPYVMGQYAWHEWLYGFRLAESETKVLELEYSKGNAPNWGYL